MLEISNPTPYPTEVTNLDFDKKFKEDIETLNFYEEIKNGNNEKEKRVVFLPVRETGASLWGEVVNAVAKKNKIDELKKQLESAPEEEKQKLTQEIEALNTVPPEVDYPRRVDSDKILHLVVTGPPKSGKSHVAKTVSSLHNRALIKLDEVIEWVMNSGSQLSNKITNYLKERSEQKELAAQEREKAFKKAGKKAEELKQKIGPANEHMYEHLTE